MRLPKFKIDQSEFGSTDGSEEQNYEFFRNLCSIGLKNKIKSGEIDANKKQDYVKQAKYELKVIKDLGFIDYFLLVWEVVNYCIEQGIAVGIGRGSASSSLLLFLSNITKIDPIKHNLIFERFLSTDRVEFEIIDGEKYFDGGTLPDIDLDFDYYKRPKLLEYLQEKYDAVKILNLNTFAGKQLIKDCGKTVAEYSEEQMNAISSLLPVEYGKVMGLEEACEEEPDFKEWCDNNKEIYQIACKLRGLIRNRAVHASGMLIPFGKSEDNFPMELTSGKDKTIVSSYDMGWSGNIAIKLDVLGLKTLAVVDETCKMIGIKYTDINVNDPFIYRHYQDFNYPYGIFQLEAWAAQNGCKKIKPKNLDELSAVLAICRPGALQFLDDYANFTNNNMKERAGSGSDKLDDILLETGNSILYQETMMRVAVEVFNLSKNDSNKIRKCVTGDTHFISKTRGCITINSLMKNGYKDDLFLVMDENGKQFWKPIQEIWETGTKNTEKLKCNNGMSIRVTRKHQILTDDGWKARMYLNKEEDKIVCAKKINYDGKNLISDDLAIVMAGLITEGYFVITNSGATFVNYDECIKQRFINAFENEFGKDKINICGKNNSVIYIRKNEKDKIAKYLKRGKSQSKEIPECMMGMTLESTRKFLSFIFACEGTVYEKELSITSKSEKLIQQIQLLLLRFGIRSNRIYKKNKDYGMFYSLSIRDNKEVKKFEKELSCMLQDYKKRKLNIYANSVKIKNFTKEIVPERIFSKFRNQYGYLNASLDNSGVYYKTGMSFDKFKDYALKSNDKKWIDFSNGNHEYIDIEDICDKYHTKTYDFTIDEETPYIIANGIVIHNCAGKKKHDQMLEWKDVIFQKGKELKIEKAAEFYWNCLNDSANYLFCAGHSFPYATLSAITTYLKFKYPTEFFLSLLKMTVHEQDPMEQIAIIEKEMEHFGIKLLPPDLIKSKMDFSLEDGNIRYGLADVKGINTKSIEKLSLFQGSYSNKMQVFQNAKDAGISMSVLCPLIQAGALTGFKESRTKMVFEAQVWNKLTQKEKTFATKLAPQFNNNLFDIIRYMRDNVTEDGKPYIKESRMATLRRDTEAYKKIYEINKKNEKFANWWYEKKLLGFACKDRLKDIFYGQLRLVGLEEINSHINKSITVIGTAKSVHKRVSKNKNEYIDIVLEDEKSELKVKLFKNQNKIELCEERNGRLPEKGDILVVKGQAKQDCLFAEEVVVQNLNIYMKLSELKDLK